jgi:hypothetical protein
VAALDAAPDMPVALARTAAGLDAREIGRRFTELQARTRAAEEHRLRRAMIGA